MAMGGERYLCGLRLARLDARSRRGKTVSEDAKDLTERHLVPLFEADQVSFPAERTP